MKIGGWRRRIPTVCKRYFNTDTKHERLITALQLPEYDRMSSGFIIVAEANIVDQITHSNARYILNLYNLSVLLQCVSLRGKPRLEREDD